MGLTETLQRRFPSGVRPLFAGDARRRREIEMAMTTRLESEGYGEVIVPMLDYADLYFSVADGRMRAKSYRFVDRDGELVGLRSDFTPMVARVVAPHLAGSSLPLRLFYRGEVVRPEPTLLGREGDFFQVGFEIVGADDAASEAEVIRLSSQLLLAVGVTPVVVVSGDAIVDALLHGAADVVAARSALARRDATSLEALTPELPELRRAALQSIVRGEHDLGIVRAAIPQAVERLDAVIERASIDGVTISLVLDDVAEERVYYSGIRFRLYGDDGRRQIGGGGRYDRLYGTFGADAPAVGATLTLDAIAVGGAR